MYAYRTVDPKFLDRARPLSTIMISDELRPTLLKNHERVVWRNRDALRHRLPFQSRQCADRAGRGVQEPQRLGG